MAKIPVERTSGGGWWKWLLGLLLLGLAIWLVAELITEDDEYETAEIEAVEPVAPATTPAAAGTMATLAAILNNPDEYIGETFPGVTAEVVEVPTDRGFWIEADGQRMFAIVIDEPREQRVDINPGQTVQINQGMLRDRTFLPDIPGDPLDADTQRLAEEQEIFLVVDERYINVMEGGNPQPGTDPAQSVQQ